MKYFKKTLSLTLGFLLCLCPATVYGSKSDTVSFGVSEEWVSPVIASSTTPDSSANAFALDVSKLKDGTLVDKSDNVIQLEKMKPRKLDKNKKELNKNHKKINDNFKATINNKAANKMTDKKTEVIITKAFDITNEQFESALKRLKTSLDSIEQQENPNDYKAKITLEQLEELESLEEVLMITDPYEPKEEFIMETSEPKRVMLNAATDVTGIEQARTDFDVTGDADGNETSYTKNDVVIAVVDTGIDTGHYDLDGGKVIAWYDAVNGRTSPYDDYGHGTHVASIAAGTGDGNSSYTGVAPGAALVGVKVASVLTSHSDILEGLTWVYDHLDTYSIDAVNCSFGGHDPYETEEDVIDMMEQIRAEGVAVFVAAGNEGDGLDEEGDGTIDTYYDTLSTYAQYISTSVGSIKDPTEGGWGLSKFSSRGTGSTGPYIVACGESIMAARYNTTNDYISKNGTSMATPMVTGTYALMVEAAYNNGGGTFSFHATDMGEDGPDKNYGGGRLLPYESIKVASGYTNGTFNSEYSYLCDQAGSVQQGYTRLYPVQCDGSSFNVTLIITDENMADLDLVIWTPGNDPYEGDPYQYYVNEEDDLPQECFTMPTNPIGLCYVGVYGKQTANFTVEMTGKRISIPD